MAVATDRATLKIISLAIDLLTYRQAIDTIMALGKNRQSSYVCFANVHMTIEAYEDEHFAQQVNNASLVLADGMPLVKGLKFFYRRQQERIAGMDIMPDLIKIAADSGLKVFFFGTTPEILEGIRQRAVQENPALQIAGLLSPPFEKSLDDPSYINIINDSGAHLVFIALGCPKQEKWMAKHSSKIQAPLLGVGGAFPVYAGVTDRAPRFMQNAGLEWLFRLAQEPRRLFMRYLKTNSHFVYLALRFKLSQLFSK